MWLDDALLAGPRRWLARAGWSMNCNCGTTPRRATLVASDCSDALAARAARAARGGRGEGPALTRGEVLAAADVWQTEVAPGACLVFQPHTMYHWFGPGGFGQSHRFGRISEAVEYYAALDDALAELASEGRRVRKLKCKTNSKYFSKEL